MANETQTEEGFEEQLAQIEGWEGVSEEEVVLPDQTYMLQVQGCRMMRSKSETQQLMFVVTWAVIDGSEYDGETFATRDFPEDVPRGARRTKQLIRKLGFEPPARPELVKKVADEIDEAAPQLEAKVTGWKSKSGYQNYNVDPLKLLAAGERVDRPRTSRKKDKKTVGASGTAEKIDIKDTVSFMDDGEEDGSNKEEHTGVVEAIKGKIIHIHEEGEDPDDPWKVPLHKVTLVSKAGAVEDEGAGEEPAEPDDLDDLDRDGLKAVIKEEELEVTIYKGWSDDKAREAIREARPEPEPDEPTEEQEPEEPKEPAEPEEPAEKSEANGDAPRISVDDLIAIAQAAGIKITDSDSGGDVVDKLKAKVWDKAKLSEDEIDKLHGIGCKFKAAASRGTVSRAARPRAAKTGKKKKKKKGRKG